MNKQKTTKLSLEKFQHSKLSNATMISGGEGGPITNKPRGGMGEDNPNEQGNN